MNNFLDADRQEGIDLLVGFVKFDEMHEDYKRKKEKYGSDGLAYRLDRKGALRLRKRKLSGNSKFFSKTSYPLNLYWLPGDLQSHLRAAALSLARSTEYQSHPPLSFFFASNGLSDLFVANALKEIDHRASLYQPWWVVKGKNSGFDDAVSLEETTKGEVDSMQDISVLESTLSTSARRGYILGSLIVTLKAPITTAITIVCFILLANSLNYVSLLSICVILYTTVKSGRIYQVRLLFIISYVLQYLKLLLLS